MQIVLARQRVGGAPLGGPPEVHAYRVPSTSDVTTETGDAPVLQGDPFMWVSPCGFRVKPDEVEIVDSFTGAPCMACFMAAAMASDVAPVTRDELVWPPEPEPSPQPVPEIGERLSEAVVRVAPDLVSLSWRGKVVHRVTTDAPRTELDGRPLVIGFCGGLGWGPYDSAPDGWDPCAECDQIAGGRT